MVLVLVTAGLLIIFSIQNAAEIEVQFLFWSMTTRRAFLIFGVFVIGIVIGWCFHSVRKSTQETEPGTAD